MSDFYYRCRTSINEFKWRTTYIILALKKPPITTQKNTSSSFSLLLSFLISFLHINLSSKYETSIDKNVKAINQDMLVDLKLKKVGFT